MKNFSQWLKTRTVLEYETYVDDEGYGHDDEGNVSFVGKQYAGGTYGLHDLPRRHGGEYTKPILAKRKQVDPSFIDSIKKALEFKENNFLRSLLLQIESGKGLSDKQIQIGNKILDDLRVLYRQTKASQTDVSVSSSNLQQIEILKKALAIKDSDFLSSILARLQTNKELTENQKKAVRRSLYMMSMRPAADYFR